MFPIRFARVGISLAFLQLDGTKGPIECPYPEDLAGFPYLASLGRLAGKILGVCQIRLRPLSGSAVPESHPNQKSLDV